MREVIFLLIMLAGLMANSAMSGVIEDDSTLAISDITNIKTDSAKDFELLMKTWKINDTILSFVDGRDFLMYYTCGHIWAVVAQADNGALVAVSGNSYYNELKIDTISECPMLTWGLYSMMDESKGLVRKEKPEYIPCGHFLELYSADKEILFKSDYKTYYEGGGAKTFTTNVNQLNYILLWLSLSEEYRVKMPISDLLRFQ